MYTTKSVRRRAARKVARFVEREGHGGAAGMARDLGVTRAAVSAWASGTRLPSAALALRILGNATKV